MVQIDTFMRQINISGNGFDRAKVGQVVAGIQETLNKIVFIRKNDRYLPTYRELATSAETSLRTIDRLIGVTTNVAEIKPHVETIQLVALQIEGGHLRAQLKAQDAPLSKPEEFGSQADVIRDSLHALLKTTDLETAKYLVEQMDTALTATVRLCSANQPQSLILEGGVQVPNFSSRTAE
ncbi:MAG: hypothetical protein V1909_05140 [Candidatus Micrarchaeota archaeon]